MPAAEHLTREQMQPAAEQAAQQLDAGAQQLTQEVMKPTAQVSLTSMAQLPLPMAQGAPSTNFVLISSPVM